MHIEEGESLSRQSSATQEEVMPPRRTSVMTQKRKRMERSEIVSEALDHGEKKRKDRL